MIGITVVLERCTLYAIAGVSGLCACSSRRPIVMRTALLEPSVAVRCPLTTQRIDSPLLAPRPVISTKCSHSLECTVDASLMVACAVAGSHERAGGVGGGGVLCRRGNILLGWSSHVLASCEEFVCSPICGSSVPVHDMSILLSSPTTRSR